MPQTKAIIEQLQVNPKPIPIAPSFDQSSKIIDQTINDSNAQMSNLLNVPSVSNAPPASVPAAAPSIRLDKLKQFKEGDN